MQIWREEEERAKGEDFGIEEVEEESKDGIWCLFDGAEDFGFPFCRCGVLGGVG